MSQPIALRQDYSATRLRRISRESDDSGQVRRLLALAMIYEGGSRTKAAEVGGVTLQVVRDWVLWFNGRGPEGLIHRKAPGQSPRLNDEHRAALCRWSRTVRPPPTLAAKRGTMEAWLILESLDQAQLNAEALFSYRGSILDTERVLPDRRSMQIRSGGFFDDGDDGPPEESFWPVLLLIAGTVGMLALIAWVFPFSYGQ